MNYRRLHAMLIVVVAIVFATTSLRYGTCAKLYVLDDHFLNKVSTPLTRLKRQTHPAATIAKLPAPDTNAFVPVSSPSQQFNNFQSNNNYFPNIDATFSNAVESQPRVQDTPVEYLLPPNPNSQPTALNFQDPAANLQNIDNIFDVTPSSVSSSPFAPPPLPSGLRNQIGHPPSPTPPSSFANEQVQSIAFQSPSPPFGGFSGVISQTPPPPVPSQQHNQFFSNKISNTIRDTTSASAGLQFPPQPIQFANGGATTATEKSPSSGAKWDLGWDANEILAPPRDETFGGRGNEYDTINTPKFRRAQPTATNANSFQTNGGGFQQFATSPPGSFISSSFSSRPPSHLTGPNQFTQFAAGSQNINTFGPSNDQFIPVNGPWGVSANNAANPSSSSHFANDQSNVIWGGSKSQHANFGSPPPSANPTPFLPTIPPPSANSVPSNGLTPPNNNGLFIGSVPPPPPPSSSLQNYQSNAFFQQGQPPPPPQTHAFHQSNFVNQNSPPLEPPHTSQFDSFLPQGTVSDHSFPTVNDNFRHFRKRQIFGEDETVGDEEQDEVAPVKEDDFKPAGVYSFVKTDRDGHFKWSVRHPTRR